MPDDFVFSRFVVRFLVRWLRSGGAMVVVAMVYFVIVAALMFDRAGWAALAAGPLSLLFVPVLVAGQWLEGRLVDRTCAPLPWPERVGSAAEVHAVCSTSKPFVLYLRSRTGENDASLRVKVHTIPGHLRRVRIPGLGYEYGDVPEVTETSVNLVPRNVERVLIETTRPIVSIINPADPTPPKGVRWLIAWRGFAWLGIVDLLAPQAAAIVMWYLGPSPGVRSELDVIQQQEGLRERTILVLGPQVALPAGTWPHVVRSVHDAATMRRKLEELLAGRRV